MSVCKVSCRMGTQPRRAACVAPIRRSGECTSRKRRIMNTNTRPFSSARDEVNINTLFAACLYFEKGLVFGPAYMTPTSPRLFCLIFSIRPSRCILPTPFP